MPSEERTGKRFEKDPQGLATLYNAMKASCPANSPTFLMTVAYILV